MNAVSAEPLSQPEVQWTRWSDQRPPDKAPIRLKTGAGKHGPEERYVRRGNALCVIDPSGSHLVVLVRQDDLDWVLA